MFKKIFRIITYLLLLLIALLLADFYKQPLFIFLIMLLLVLPLVSYFLCRRAFDQLVPFVRSSSAYGHSGDCITAHIGLHNSCLLPLADCTLLCTLSSSFYPCDIVREINIPAYARNDFSFDLPLTFHKCGCYQLTLQKLTVHDYLHFFTYSRTCHMQTEIMIYPPQNTELAFESSAYGEGFDEFEETSAKGNVSSNVTDIREYIPGDRLQRIHWKLSAKINKYMVKENEQTASSQFTVLTELFAPDAESDFLEKALSNARTISNVLLAEGESFFFCFYSTALQDFTKALIQNREQLEDAFAECFYQSPYPQENLALEIMQRASLMSGTILHVTHKGVEDVVS